MSNSSSGAPRQDGEPAPTAGNRDKYVLYVAADFPNSREAKANILAIFNEYPSELREIEIVDVLLDPQRALNDGVYMTPALIKVSAASARKIPGALNRRESILDALGFSAGAGGAFRKGALAAGC